MYFLVFNYVSARACVAVRGYVHADVSAHRGQSVLSCLMWVLETELASSVKPEDVLNHWALSPARGC